MKNRKIIILDDHTLFLKGMSFILKECCSDCDIFTYQSIKKLKSDKLKFDEFSLLISDIELPDENTFELFASLKEKHPNFPILVVSMHKKNAIIKKCKQLGIEGYMLKDEDEQLTVAVQKIISGETYYSKRIIDFCNQNKSRIQNLSLREEEIIKLIANGYNNAEISEKLFLAIETVKTHKRNIRLKLNVESISEITEYANKNFLM